MGLQTVWTITEASSLALKAEQIEKSPRGFATFCEYPPPRSTDIEEEKEQNMATKSYNVGVKAGKNSSTNAGSSLPNKTAAPNPDAKPYGDKCYRCSGQGHRSNIFPS
ncbi:hypothetical protein LINPERHAP2_LOCUS28958 [Linum perenne]